MIWYSILPVRATAFILQKRIEKHPISIPQALREGSLNFTAERIGIVAPVYGHEVPAMVKDFLKKADFHTDYFYMILTYGVAMEAPRSWQNNYARIVGSQSAISTSFSWWIIGCLTLTWRKKSSWIKMRKGSWLFILDDIKKQKQMIAAGYREGSSRPSGISRSEKSNAFGPLAASYMHYRRLHRLRHL